MTKLLLALVLLLMVIHGPMAQAESTCDIRMGNTLGVRVVEFTSGNTVHSKMSMNEMSVSALAEELVSLQDMGVCEEKLLTKKCVLRYEKTTAKNHQIALYRGADRWLAWVVSAKSEAQNFVKNLQKMGLCT